MRAKWILSLLFLFLPLSLYAQNGYSTNYTWGVSDLSARMSNTNLWYAVKDGTGAQGLCNSVPAIGSDVVPVCVSNGTAMPGTNNTVWYYDTANFNWTTITQLGSGWLAVASVNLNDLYLLKPATACSGNGYGIFHWDGSTVTEIYGCATQIHAQDDGGIIVTNSLKGIYYLPAGSSVWNSPGNDTTTGWSYASAADVNDMCGVKNGVIYTYNSGAGGNSGKLVQLSTQPPASINVYTCQMADDPNTGLVMFSVYETTNNHGQGVNAFAFYDFTTGVWTQIMLPPNGIMSAASIGKWPTVILDKQGYVWHFNVYGIYHAATLTGVYNQCPPPNTNCPSSGVTHNGTVQATLPGGLYGATGLAYPTPAENMNLTSWDISATGSGCDALFGNPKQCVPKDTGTIICSASKFSFTGTPSNGNPPEPQTHWTEYAGGFDGFFTNISSAYYNVGGHTGYVAKSLAGYADNACWPNTYSVCQPPNSSDTVTITTACVDIQGHACNATDPVYQAQYEAKKHMKAKGTVWGAFFNYTPGMTASCDRITVYDTKTGTVCF